jgi:hypothetical protein
MPRVHERVNFIAQIDLESSSGKREVRVTDISVGGCYIDSIMSVSVDEPLKFDLVHPKGGRLPFTGAVAYHFDGVGFGVRFTNMNDEQKLFLSRIVRT